MQLIRHFAVAGAAGSLLLALPAACSPAAPEAPAAPGPQASQAEDHSWMDEAQTPGDWRYVAETTETAAIFGTGQEDGVQLIIACDILASRVSISRIGASEGETSMIIRTETQTGALLAEPAVSFAPLLLAHVDARDPLLDAIAFSKGRFAVEVGGTEPIYVPAYPEITRVIEDCRS
ncbi:hypothetical protein [Aurantiacibacter gilvus]|uniref:Lipoprotein n=1 Tax=Aurantiacibacter gilvus TaxID=3139141 RepID=A0ABU9IFP0_9SPHN